MMRGFARLVLVLALCLVAVTACGTSGNTADVQTLLTQAAQQSGAGQFTDCIGTYTKVLGSSPDTVSAYIGRAGCYMAQGNAAAAVQDYDRAVALSPRDPQLYIDRAEGEESLGNVTKASDDYRKLAEFSSSGPEQLTRAADGLARMHFYPDALPLLETGLKLYANYWDLHRAKADVLVALGNDSEGLREFQNAARLAKGSALASVLADRGGYYLVRQQFKLAVADFTNAIQIDPENYKLLRGRAESRRGLGDFNGAEADLSSAIEKYQLVSQTDPDILAELFIARGKLYSQEGLKTQALADFRQALAVSRPSNSLQRASIQKLIADVGG